MKIYGTSEQCVSDDIYILEKLEKLSTLKEEILASDSIFSVNAFDAEDDDYGRVEQVGNYELEFYSYKLQNMVKIK